MEPDTSFSSISKGQLKLLRQVKHKKYRQKYKKIIIEGIKICLEIGSGQPKLIEWVVVREDKIVLLQSVLDALSGVQIVTCPDVVFSEISGLENNPGILALCQWPDFSKAPSPDRFSFYVEEIQDPGNFGTLIRTSDWFGCPRIYMGTGCVDPYNVKVIQASMGSVFRVACVPGQLDVLSEQYEVIGTTLFGSFGHERKTEKPLLFVMGNESRGMSENARRYCHQFWSIPSRTLGAESLNVGVAAGILAAQWY